jgi:imidazoleglycerol-phosphate dehydratase
MKGKPDSTIKRDTRETRISAELYFEEPGRRSIDTSLPFFNHLLEAMSFHGGFGLIIKAEGDIEVDPHHLVEDTGLVIGMLFDDFFAKTGGVTRFSHNIIPMDEALAEVTIDICGRPTCVYVAEYPQPLAGTFDLSLIREFMTALSQKGKMALHAEIRRGENGHHMAEALFKALGKALKQAFAPMGKDATAMSTKGTI